MEKETSELESVAISIISQSENIVIKDTESLKKIVSLNNGANLLKKKINATFNPIIEKTRMAWKESIAQRDKFIDPLDKIIDYNKGRIQVYNNEQDRKRAEKEARLRAEELKRQEEERLREAVRLEQEGKNKEAEEVINEKPQPVHIAIQQEKVEGLYFVVEWKFRIIDESKIPREYLIPDEIKIGKIVRAMKNLTNIEGIEVYSEKKPRQRI